MTTPAQIAAAAPWRIRPFGDNVDIVDAAGRVVLLGFPPDPGYDREQRLAIALLAAAALELRSALEAAISLNIIIDPAGLAWLRQAETAITKSYGK